jgi:hypothetical protein
LALWLALYGNRRNFKDDIKLKYSPPQLSHVNYENDFIREWFLNMEEPGEQCTVVFSLIVTEQSID